MEPFEHEDNVIHAYILHQDQLYTAWIVASWTRALHDARAEMGRDHYDWAAYIGICPTTWMPMHEHIINIKRWGTKAPQVVAEYYFGDVARRYDAPWRD